MNNCEFKQLPTTVSKLSIKMLPPILDDESLDLRGNCIILHNAGEATITVDSVLTIKAGATFTMGVNEPIAFIDQCFDIAFASTGSKRLEIVTQTYTNQKVSAC